MIITVGNNKGGTGKTTVSVHLAVALAKLGKKTLLIDNDPQCNTSKWVLSNIGKTMDDLLDKNTINDTIDIMEFAVPATSHENLWCIPNSVKASGLTLFFSQNFPESLFYLRQKIREQAEDFFDFTIIDCPPTLDVTFGMALCASDAVIVPIEVGSIYSVEGLVQVLEIIREMREPNPELTFLKLVMNKSDRRTSITKSMIELIKSKFDGMHFETILPVCTAIQQAEFARKTLFAFAPATPAVSKFKDLAKELIEVTNG